ncbi:hypothetical protein [Massilia sp. S19_KUP03_FR1]|uniref:hypothetical protein n=1 Tax=Massilia sp. S19_KUP03_FR1 TaxID=3025503 RepID=UPI002FCDA42A
MQIRRILAPLLALCLAAGIGSAIYISAHRKADQRLATMAAAAVVDIKGMIGSEKESFFLDPQVQDILSKKYALRVSIEKVGSREIAARDFKGYDFAYPAGLPAAIALQTKSKAKQTYSTFFTPIAVASWRQLVPLLEREGIVRAHEGSFYIVDMKRLLDLIGKGTRWRDLQGNTVYATGKSILINSTDVRKSNSAAMFLSLASYIANDNNVVENVAQVNQVMPLVAPLFVRQGLQEGSSAGPFDDYTTMGIGKAPLVIVYESQFLAFQSQRAQPNPDMVLLYPQPTIYTKHIVVPFTEQGHKLGQALASDPDLQRLAVRHGYRTAVPDHFSAFLKEKKLDAPPVLVDVIEPPNLELLERMIAAIEQKLQ